MILVDANLLLYAYDAASERQTRAKAWLEEVLSGDEVVAMPWQVLLAFLRLSTAARVYSQPLTTAEAVAVVSSWLERPWVVQPVPGERHWRILSSLLTGAQVRGPSVSDAHLAALALEHGAILATTDRDFTRFPGLKLLDPLNA